MLVNTWTDNFIQITLICFLYPFFNMTFAQSYCHILPASNTGITYSNICRLLQSLCKKTKFKWPWLVKGTWILDSRCTDGRLGDIRENVIRSFITSLPAHTTRAHPPSEIPQKVAIFATPYYRSNFMGLQLRPPARPSSQIFRAKTRERLIPYMHNVKWVVMTKRLIIFSTQ